MARIRQMSPLLAAQVAAGEVVDRPASVVKELLENSVDAGARRIDVEVAHGGTDLIRVVDDGSGIDPEDLLLAFASHATSKLFDADDLAHVETLGFRGEALASVGAVAQVVLQSRPPGRDCGAEVRCHGGQISPVQPWNGTPGTRIEVRHLFFNVPARRKFLRGSAAELAQVSEVFTRLTLSQLSLHLTLKHNGKSVYEVPGTAGLRERVGLFFGDELRRSLLPVEAESERRTVGGYVADPACDQGGPQVQYLFVNGRWVRDRGLTQALREAYRGLLITGRHPAAFLFLDVPPDEVDVNVHPAKSEVRFRRPEAVQKLLLDAVHARLHHEDLTARLRVREPQPGPAAPPEPTLPFEQPLPASAPTRTAEAGRGPSVVPGPIPPPVQPAPTAPPAGVAPVAEQRTSPLPSPDRVSPSAARQGPSPPAQPPAEEPPGQPVKAVQMHDRYLVVEVPKGVLVIDQHALHERVLFEQLQAHWRSGRLEAQRLLVPEPVALPPAQTALVLEQREALAELGLEVSDFGGGTVLLTSFPALLAKQTPGSVLRAVAEHLASVGRAPDRAALLHELLSLVACHSAVRAGDRLTPEEIQALAAQRELAQDGHHCPHGRPTSLLLTRRDLDRQFRRT